MTAVFSGSQARAGRACQNLQDSSIRLQPLRFGENDDLTSGHVCLDDRHAQSVERASPRRLIRLVATRIAVANAKQAAGAAHGKFYSVACDGHHAPRVVNHLDLHHRDILSVAADGGAIREQSQGRR